MHNNTLESEFFSLGVDTTEKDISFRLPLFIVSFPLPKGHFRYIKLLKTMRNTDREQTHHTYFANFY